MNQNELYNTLKTNEENKPIAQQKNVASPLELMLTRPDILSKFESVLKDKTSQFIGSILSLVKNDNYLSKCTPKTILASAMQAATLDLPINKTLGYAYIVPYKNDAQLQLGYKGYIQLALRSGQYKSINVTEIYDGELISYNRLTEELVINCDNNDDLNKEVIGYAAYIELVNGFKKTIYWSKSKVINHAEKYSKSYRGGNKIWQDNFDAMACKTVLKSLLAKYGLLSIEMQKAFIKDDNSAYSNNEDYLEDDVITLDDDAFEVTDDAIID